MKPDLQAQIENLRTLRWDKGEWGMHGAPLPGGVDVLIMTYPKSCELVLPSDDDYVRRSFATVEEAKAEAQRWWSEELDKAMKGHP